MTATERLRAMLDELGVEWVDTGDGSTLIPAQTATDVAWDVNTWPSGKDMGDFLWVQNRHPLTPEQAIEATLGSSELRKERDALDRLTDVLNATNDGLLAENAKLRECLQDLAEHIREDDGFGLDYGWMLDRMRELGIEV